MSIGGITGGSAPLQPTPVNAASNKSTLSALQEQYPNLKFTAASFANEGQLKKYAMGCSGKGNVAIAPEALTRMETDSKFRAKIEKSLGEMEEADRDDTFEKRLQSGGSQLVASGWTIDKDGNMNGWAITYHESGGDDKKTFSKGKTPQEIAEQSRAKRKEQEKELEAKRQERREADRLEAERLNESASLTEVTGEGSIGGASPTGARLDVDA